MLSKLSRHLSQEEHACCEGLLTIEECFAALSGMARGKTLGSDGLPMEFYHLSVLIWFVSSTLLTRPASSFPILSVVG